MDELVIEKRMGYYITHVVLNVKHDIKMLRGFNVDEKSGKRYMANLMIMVGDEPITSHYADSIQFKEELALFDRGDNQNIFLTIVAKQIEKSQKKSDNTPPTLYSLQPKIINNKNVFISRSEAKAMTKIWEMGLQGFTFTGLVENKEVMSQAMWYGLLYLNGYIINEKYKTAGTDYEPCY